MIAIISSLFLVFLIFRARQPSGTKKKFLFLMFIKLALIIYYLTIDQFDFANRDAKNYIWGIWQARDIFYENYVNFGEIYRSLSSKFISFLYYILVFPLADILTYTFDNYLILYAVVSIFASILTSFLTIHFLNDMVRIDDFKIYWVSVLLILNPISLFLTTFPLREWLFFSLFMGVAHLTGKLDFNKGKKIAIFLLLASPFLFSSVFHGPFMFGLLAFCLCVILFRATTSITMLFLASGSMIGVIALIGFVGVAKIDPLVAIDLTLLAEGAEKYGRGSLVLSQDFSSTYLVEFLTKLPLRSLNFFIGPLIGVGFDLRNILITSYYLSFNVMFILVINLAIRQRGVSNKIFFWSLILGLLGVLLIYSMVHFNYGNSVRHHFKGVGIMLLAANLLVSMRGRQVVS